MATAGKKPLAELFSELSLHTDLPRRIGGGWDNLLIRLGLTGVDLEHINHDHQRLQDKIKDGLLRWNTQKKQTPVSKRAADFLEALRAEEMVQLVEELEAEYDFNDVTMKLELLSENEENENPNIVRLQKMVDKNFEEKGEDSTFIVFVEQRESAVAVSKYLREKSSFAKCCFLISAQSTPDGDGKQSQGEQNRVVKKLLSKQINGLVATQVAEEGLDIPACNFVIRYNKSSNEISTIQAAGRSRAKDGTIIDFADKRKHRKEKENVMKLALMNQALDAVLGRPADNIRLEVTKHIDSLIQIEAEEERSREAGRKNKKEGNFTLRCWRCQEVAVSSHDIRRYKESNYIVVGEDFYKKAKRRLNKKVRCYENMTTKYKVDCKNCGSEWGEGNCMQNWFFAVLKIKQFIVKDDDTGKEYCRVPWSALPHTVQTITDFSSLPALDKLIEDSTDT